MNIQPIFERGKSIVELFVDDIPAKMVKGEHCRQVFKYGNYYIKFDNHGHGKVDNFGCGIQSRLELEFLADVAPEDRKYFNIPVAYGKIKGLYYTVQREIIPARRWFDDVSDYEENEMDRLKAKYELTDIRLPDRNCVLTEDSFVIYDYAPINSGKTVKRGLHTIKRYLDVQEVPAPTNVQLYLNFGV
jgi:hypothetical protein